MDRDSTIAGFFRFAIVSPEAADKLFTSLVNAKTPIRLFVYDECHCIHDWGDTSFRPAFASLLPELRARHVDEFPPVLALTATMRVSDEASMLNIMGMDAATRVVHRVPVRRDNVSLHVMRKSGLAEDMLVVAHILRERIPGSIVYRITRKDCNATADKLRAAGIPCVTYYGCKGDAAVTEVVARKKQNEANMQAWMAGTAVVVATAAFGMGVDKADVRVVVNYDCPQSLESIAQEEGRAGRDGKHADHYVFVGHNDFITWRGMLDSMKDPITRERNLKRVDEVEKWAHQQVTCRVVGLFKPFDDDDTFCAKCDLCVSMAAMEDADASGARTILTMLASSHGSCSE